MAITIWIQSRFINAAIFFIVDVLGLWCIHRCLKGLQGYYLYQLARSGKRIPIVRSTIPIFSGELLKGFTRVGVLFVIGNALAIILAFCATLGVNGETVDHWMPIPRSNTTSLISGDNDWHENSKFSAVAASCFTANNTHFAFWPVAFNIDEERSILEPREDERVTIWPINPTCQKEAPGVRPLVMIECIKIDNEPCTIYDKKPSVQLKVNSTIVRSSKPNGLKSEYNFSVVHASEMDESGINTFRYLDRKEGLAFVMSKPVENGFINNTIVFLKNETENRVIFSSATKVNSTYFLFRPVLLTPAEVLSPKSVTMEKLRDPWDLPQTEFSNKNVPVLVQHVFSSDIYRSASLTEPAYKKSKVDVTIISNDSIILYSVLLFLLFALFFAKELLLFLVLRKKGISAQEVFATDFDHLSRSLRKSMERENDMAYSGGHAELGLHIDDGGISRVCPTVNNARLQW